MVGNRRNRTELIVNEETAFAYIRGHKCLPRGKKKHSFNDQLNRVRRLARKDGLDMKRRFFDREGTHKKPEDTLPLHRRLKLARLYLAVQALGVRSILVADRLRLDEDEAVQSLLVDAFFQVGVRVIEATTSLVLSEALPVQDVMAALTPDRRRSTRRLVASWKALVTRLQNKSRLGRKSFGSLTIESWALTRIRKLYRVLPKWQWRKRGNTVLKRRSFRAIAERLNSECVPSRTGRPWSAKTVHGILRHQGLVPKSPIRF